MLISSMNKFLYFINPQNEFPNGSDHAMIACYLELYEEGEVEHINGVWPNSKHPQLVGRTILYNAHRKRFAHA